MPTLTVDGKEVTVEPGATVLQACEAAGAEIPRFCYHERLSIAGNCRMCLVEMEKSPKPIASCAMPAGDGMIIHTKTETVKKAREGVMEFLLINHPLDCPICDQGGECDLQDQAMGYGRAESRFDELKRAVDDKNMGPLISTTMTRCIHCMRCVRFATEIAGAEELGSLGRGEHTEVTTYLEGTLNSEVSGNVIDLCPVGALTSKPYAFTARSWELKKTETIDVMDGLGSNIRLDTRGNQVMRILPRLHEDINEEWISDKTRFHYDGLRVNRLDQPYVSQRGKLKEADWSEAFKAVAKALKGKDGSKVGAVVGGMADMESMYALKDLLASLGAGDIECRLNDTAISTKNRGDYLMNSSIAGLESADACLLVGCNPRYEGTIANLRLRKGVKAGTLKVANVGTPNDLTYPVTELGNDLKLLSEAVDKKGKIANFFKGKKSPIVMLGRDALSGKSGANILETCLAIAEKYGAKFNILNPDASRVAALDLGFVTKAGIKGMAKKDVVFLLGADDFDMSILKNACVVYIGSHGDAGARHADVILPAAAYAEKSGIYINSEGRVQVAQKAIFAPGDAREDWTIFRALSEVLGKPLKYNSLAELRSTMVASYPYLTAVDQLPQENVSKGSKKELSGAIKPLAFNYYGSNAIARSSEILGDVTANYASMTMGASGTHG